MADTSSLPPEADALRLKGNEALGRRDHAAARDCYTRALAIAPASPVLLSNRAAAFANLGEWRSALEDAKECVAVAPDWAKGHIRAGAAHFALDQHAEAEAAYVRALEILPGAAAVEAALADVRRALAKKQLDAQLMPAVVSFAQRKEAGQALLKQARYDEAAAEYRAALDAMGELLGQLPSEKSNPMHEMLRKLGDSMEAELAQAVRAQQAAAGGGGGAGT